MDSAEITPKSEDTRKSLPWPSSSSSRSSTLSLPVRELRHVRVRSLDLKNVREPTTFTHARGRSFEVALPSSDVRPVAPPIRQDNVLCELSDDCLSNLFAFLSRDEILDLCISSAKSVPQIWVAASLQLNIEYHEKAVACREVSFLCEIASQGNAAAQEEMYTVNEELTMLLHDVRAADRNEGRYEVEVQDKVAQERSLACKFQACVDILQEVMTQWNEACKARDEVALFLQDFHRRVRLLWTVA